MPRWPARRLVDRIDEMLTLDRGSGCWLWTGGLSKGYPIIKLAGKSYRANRLMYELFKEPIPPELHALHKCDIKRCLNPEHMYLGTQADNTADYMASGRFYSANREKTECKRGHDITDILPNKRGQRVCPECNKLWCQWARDKVGNPNVPRP